MVKDFLRKKLAPKIKDMRVKKVIICLDKGLNFKREEVKEELRLGGADNVGDAWILPTNTAKRVSPLDNTLLHSQTTSPCKEPKIRNWDSKNNKGRVHGD